MQALTAPDSPARKAYQHPPSPPTFRMIGAYSYLAGFEEYLREVYFAGFDPDASHIEASRNSVGHGVANTSEFNLKNATISILIIHQLSYFLRTERDRSTVPDEQDENE